MKIKYLYLILENCEQIVIDAADAKEIDLVVDQHNLRQIENSDLLETFTTKNVYLLLNKSANKHYYWFDDGITFDRILSYNDITGIEIVFDNGNSNYYIMPWENGKTDLDNCLQRAEILNNGDLILYIGQLRDEEWKEMIEYANLSSDLA